MNEAKKRFIAGELTVSIPARVSALIKDGTLEGNFFVSSGGLDCWFRYTDPSKKHISYTVDGIIEGLDAQSVSPPITPSPKLVSKIRPFGRKPSVEEFFSGSDDDGKRVAEESNGSPGLATWVPKTINEALRVIDEHGLNHHRQNGVLNALPSDSLTAVDFKRPIYQLVARGFAVAHKKGHARLLGTIGNQVDAYGCENIRKWWMASTAADKVKLLSNGKHLSLRELTDFQVHNMSNMLCPF